MRFEWSKSKNKINKRKHGVSFEMARIVFHDSFVLSVPDDRYDDYGEERWQSIGLINDVVIYVAHAVKEETDNEEESIRIISARAATPREEQQYYDFRRKCKRH